jgi:hypothetical protein
MDFIRVWKEMDLDEIEKHIVLVDDIQGFCPSCKKTGIKYEEFAKCPSCGSEFKYAATREKAESQASAHVIAKIHQKASHLVIVDYTDYSSLLNKKKTKSLFR